MVKQKHTDCTITSMNKKSGIHQYKTATIDFSSCIGSFINQNRSTHVFLSLGVFPQQHTERRGKIYFSPILSSLTSDIVPLRKHDQTVVAVTGGAAVVVATGVAVVVAVVVYAPVGVVVSLYRVPRSAPEQGK